MEFEYMHLRAISTMTTAARFGNSDIKVNPQEQLRQLLIEELGKRVRKAFSEADSFISGSYGYRSIEVDPKARIVAAIINSAATLATSRKVSD
jgi:hypothetical protein